MYKTIPKSLIILFATIIIMIILVVLFAFWPAKHIKYHFPGGKSFAIAILDDTDGATLENIQPVYEYLAQQNVISTKTVWALSSQPQEHGYTIGDSLQNASYRQFILKLKFQGFEIASHGARGASSEHAVVKEGLNLYTQVIGTPPSIHVNHQINLDNLYWGKNRLTYKALQWFYTFVKGNDGFSGQIATSKYYWGDIAKPLNLYSRDFSFYELNLAKLPGVSPRQIPEKPSINQWFYTSDGDNVNSFNKLLNPLSLDNLENEGGYSIIYTHFSKGFYQKGELNKTFKLRINDLARRNVWITTTTKLLQFLEKQHGTSKNTFLDEFRLQLRWSFEQIWYS